MLIFNITRVYFKIGLKWPWVIRKRKKKKRDPIIKYFQYYFNTD